MLQIFAGRRWLAWRVRLSHCGSMTWTHFVDGITSELPNCARLPAASSERRPDCVRVKANMMQTLGHVALVVREYDEALAFFTRTLNFRVIEDTRLSEDKRWVLIAPPGPQGTSMLLARAATPEQVSRIGNQTGGRVFLFLHTDDFWRDFNEMTARKVKFTRPPSEEPYGTVAVFEDLYGNQWDLLQLKAGSVRAALQP
jgi:catechol 2,3-dioxygenase-like lactoylglutathione lyase family enzyme